MAGASKSRSQQAALLEVLPAGARGSGLQQESSDWRQDSQGRLRKEDLGLSLSQDGSAETGT